MLVIFGGSFNPPTKAHLELYNKIKENFNCKVLVMPLSKTKYPWKDNLLDDEVRYDMLKLMFNEDAISKYEFNLNEYKGTYQMLKDHTYLDKDIYFVCGTDNLKQLDKWINYDKLISEFKFIIVKRPGDEVCTRNMGAYQDNFTILEMNNEISSTLIREDVCKYKEYLDENVYKYIVENKLYGVDINV